MKYGDEELTGKELGPIRFSFNNEKARDYVGIARRYLGDMKQRMQLADITQLYSEKALQDGTIIRMWSNKNGAADIDAVDIFSPVNEITKNAKENCIGYIIRTVTNESLEGYAYNFKIVLPDGDEFNLENVTHPSTFGEDYTTVNDFPDNNAKYVDVEEIIDFEQVFSGNYQHVSTVLVDVNSTVQGFGPVTWTWSANTIPDPTLNPGYSYVTSYAHDEGVCGQDVDYGNSDVGWTVTVDPCHINYKVFMDLPPGSTTDPVYNGGVYIQKAVFYSGSYVQLVVPFFPDQCLRDPYRWAVGPNDSFNGEPGDYLQNWNENETLVKSTYSAASEIGYNEWLDWYIEQYQYHTPFYLSNLGSYPNSGGHLHRPGGSYRRTDGRGFLCRSGLKFTTSGYELTEPGYENGDTCFFMVPTGDKKIFYYSQEIRDAYPSLNNVSENYESQVGQPGFISPVEYSNIETCIGAGGLVGSNNGTISNDLIDNILITLSTDWVPTGTFGVPINVPIGEHKVTIDSFVSITADIEIYLFFETKILKFIEKIDSFDTKEFSIFLGEVQEGNEKCYAINNNN